MRSKDFTVTSQEIEKAKKIAKEQAPSVYAMGFENDRNLCRMLAISEKVNKNYLQYLVDMFMREALYYYQGGTLKGKNIKRGYNLCGSKWEKTNPHLSRVLSNLSEVTAVLITTCAVKGYLHRVSPRLSLQPIDRIAYSLEEVALYIEHNIVFLQQLIREQPSIFPFQYDTGPFLHNVFIRLEYPLLIVNGAVEIG